MQMFGQTIDARSRFSLAGAFFLVIGAALIGWGVLINSVHPMLGAVLPICFAIGLSFGRPQRVVLLVENDGLRLFGSPEKILYREISAVIVGGRQYGGGAVSLPAQPMEIQYQRGCLVAPPVMNVDPVEFHNFLLSQMPVEPPRPVPAVLADYLSEQLAKFGPERVHLIQTRRAFFEQWRRRRRRWIGAALILAGIIWFAVATVAVVSHPKANEYAAWFVAGFWSALVGLIMYFARGSMNRKVADRQLAKHPDACIIIGPAGLAMLQGSTKGALPWREITKVSRNVSQFLQSSRTYGLQLQVRGAAINMFDIYEFSAAEIEQLIRFNLEPGAV
jgi:hypothetical protein